MKAIYLNITQAAVLIQMVDSRIAELRATDESLEGPGSKLLLANDQTETTALVKIREQLLTC